MTAPFRLGTIDGEKERPQKSHRITSSASLNLSTSYQDVITWSRSEPGGTVSGSLSGTGAWLDIGSTPAVDLTIAWTHSTGTLLSLLAVFANADDRTADPTIGAPPPYIPAATATGTTPAYPNIVTFSTTDWTTTTSPLSSATVKIVRGLLKSNGCRLVKFQLKSDAAAGSAICYAMAATGE